MTTSRFCEECGFALTTSPNFCPNCGVAIPGGTAPARGGAGKDSRSDLVRALPWLIPSLAVVAVIAFAVISGRSGSTAPADMGSGFTPGASDISQFSPDEMVDRLFNRVMAASSEGKMDTVAFFAPMAIGSFDALRPLTEHRRYDLGLIYLVSGEPALARAEADSILTVAPKHLLGLALAMRAARATGDEAARKRFVTRFLAALPTERTRDVPEYADHDKDITDAKDEAEGRTAGSPASPGSGGDD